LKSLIDTCLNILASNNLNYIKYMKKIITFVTALLLNALTANAESIVVKNCNYDYNEPDFKKFDSVLDDTASGVKVVKEEKISHDKEYPFKDVSLDHVILLKDGTSIAHRILCYDDLISSFISFFDMPNYRTDTDIKDIMKSIDEIVANTPIKSDSGFKEAWREIRKYAIKDAITKNAKFYRMNEETGEYEQLPKECRFLNENNPICPKAEDMSGYLQITEDFFNLHIKIKD